MWAIPLLSPFDTSLTRWYSYQYSTFLKFCFPFFFCSDDCKLQCLTSLFDWILSPLLLIDSFSHFYAFVRILDLFMHFPASIVCSLI